MTPYDPETHAGGHLVRDPDTGRYRVEWFPVEKAADADEQPVPFRKDDDGGTAISAKDRIKASKKRAKRDSKNRKKAETAAENNRLNLNKGVEMKEPLITVAKAMIERDYMPRTTIKRDFYETLVKLSGKRYPADKPATAFAKYVVDDENGRLLMKAHKMAPGADWRGDERPAGTGGIPQPVTSAAYDELCGIAKSLSTERGISFAKAFSQAYSANPQLVAADRANHVARVAKAYGG